MFSLFSNLSTEIKGILLIVAGSILLIHTLGWIEKGLDIIISRSALFMIIIGMQKINAFTKIMALINRKQE